MKIAKEIWSALELDELFRQYHIEPDESPVDVIAARLEPVKKALERAAHRFEYLSFGGVKECNGIDTVVASQDVRVALALFEDE